MCASSVLSWRATSPTPAQRKRCRYFSDRDRPDGTTKKQFSYFGDPQTGEVYYHQVNKQKIYNSKYDFLYFVNINNITSKRSTGTYHVSYTCRNSIPLVVLFILTWGGMWCRFLVQCVVEYPCLASPGPSRTILSQLGVLTCVLGFWFQGYVSIVSIELPLAYLPELLLL